MRSSTPPTRHSGIGPGPSPGCARRSSSLFRHGGSSTPMRFPRDLVGMLSAFADARVRYLIVGGHAVGVHARPRTTKDLDVWLDGGRDNVVRACQALTAFGAPAAIVEDLRSATPHEI